ncbi:hypothetical protein GCM10009557_01180 [Virgisporangium ochraceum]|uniref:MinD-like ATPase involved in chromosome partitioning or flagellar assembly n=1 Tax=Virgisporangium ochraceum TaxID=65505 RepID=A0A8J4A1P3_9ACTN|nr:hypothetical protein [Virgisporangium ochraceum]GIJ74149.1 hypothetical protein Voc01_090660 [Virgisporangium ochraceum]
MALLAVTSVKGRPGVTTTAVGLALTAARAVLVECDPSGGDLMLRHRLAARPTLVDLAAASRIAGTAPDAALAAGSQVLRLGDASTAVVPAPPGGAQARAALPELMAAQAPVLTMPDRLVVADCGRLTAESVAGSPTAPPIWQLLAAADVVLVLARGRADELAHLREHLGGLLDAGPGLLVVLLAPGGVYNADEVANVLRSHAVTGLARDPTAVAVLGPLPNDPKAAAALNGELLAGRRWWRLPLIAALERLLTDFAPRLQTTAANSWPAR